MPLRLTIKKELTARSDRVKSVDIYPAENPWVLSALYSGNVYIWDYSNNTLVKSFEMGSNPVRCARFIVRKSWIVAGTDDMHMRVYNYNTMEKVHEWEAHTDYIRFLEIHPSRPYILSASDDMSIKLWDWDRNFECARVFEGHSHYVMMVKINPRDTNTFASASLDKSLKVWGLTASTPHFSLDGAGAHDKGVNCVDYYPGGDKPFLLSGADDRTVKVWDYQTKACLQTLEGHQHNVSSVCFHPRLPIILSASEDGTVRLWHSTTYRPESTLNYGLERAWCIAVTKDANKVAIGYDEGTIVLKLGNERPVASLDTNSGKLVWAQGHDIQTMSVKTKGGVVDGERLQLTPRDLGACEVYPQVLKHNCNGTFIVVCGDGEYIIYTSQALRNKAFGSALEFVWGPASGDYAIRESATRVRTFKNFKEHKLVSLPHQAEAIFGGLCLGVRGADSVAFFDWEDGTLIRKIDVSPNFVFWSEGEGVVLAASDCLYTLRYDREAVAIALGGGRADPDEGVEGSFELVGTVNEKVRTGQWVGECFLYTNSLGKLNYLVGGEVMPLCHLTHPMYMLGYVPKEDRVYLVDKTYNVCSYTLLLATLSYQSSVVNRDFVTANNLLPLIPRSEYGAVARFLESQGFKEEALAVSTDDDHRFELALDLRKLEVAHSVLADADTATAESNSSKESEDSTEQQSKWRRLGDLALSRGDIPLAQLCAKRSADLSGLLLLYSSSGNKAGMAELALQAKEAGRFNVAFLAYFLTAQVEEAVQLLLDAHRIPEAAFFARTYLPSHIPRVLELWKGDLKGVNEKAAEALADPALYPNLFPDLDWALRVESVFLQGRDRHVSAGSYPTAKGDLDLDLIGIFKAQAQAQEAGEKVEEVEEMGEVESEEPAEEAEAEADSEAEAEAEAEAETEAEAEMEMEMDIEAEIAEAEAEAGIEAESEEEGEEEEAEEEDVGAGEAEGDDFDSIMAAEALLLESPPGTPPREERRGESDLFPDGSPSSPLHSTSAPTPFATPGAAEGEEEEEEEELDLNDLEEEGEGVEGMEEAEKDILEEGSEEGDW